MRQIIGLLLLGFCFPSTLPAADPPRIASGFDLIPINAAAGFAVHNLDELQAQGNAFIQNAGVQQEFSIRPSQLLEFAFGFLGVTRGRDDTKPAGIFIANLIESRVLNPSGFQEIEKLLVVAVGISDRKAMAGNFGLSEKELSDEQIVRIRKKNGSFGQLVYVRGQHLYLGNHDRAIMSVAHGKSLSDVLTKTQLARVSRSDMLLHFGTTAWGAGWVMLVQEAQERAKKLEGQETDPETGLSTEMLKLIADSLPAVQNLLFSVAIDEQGFEFNSLSIFRTADHPRARKLLELFRSGEQASTVAALPKQQLIASQAVRSDGTQNRALVRALLELSLNVWFGPKKLLAVVEQPQFVGLFDEVWQRLQGSQLAVYRNPDPATQGLFSMLAVLDTEDPDEFLKEMRELARFAKPGELKLEGDNKQADDVATVEKLIQELGDPNFRVRQSATLKLRLIGPPALPYLEKALESPDREIVARARRLQAGIEAIVEARRKDLMSHSLLSNLSARWGDFPKAENRQGVPIDIVKMDLEGPSKASESHLREAFGPDWSKVRLAVHEKKIVVLLGSNTDLIDQTLTNLKAAEPGLAEIVLLNEFHRRAPESRRAEFHLILQQFVPLLKGEKATSALAELSSLSMGVDQDSIELHLWVPNGEFKALMRFRR